MSNLEYNPFAPDFYDNPFDTYRRMQDEAPVYRSERFGWWALTRFDDVRNAVVDPDTFRSYEGMDIDDTALEQAPPGSLPNMDNPRHDDVRRVVQPYFLPRRLAEMESGIRSVVRSLIDTWHDRGAVDLAQDLAWPMPFDVFFHLMGLPTRATQDPEELARRDQLERWTHELKDRVPGTPHLTGVARAATAGVQQYFIDLLEERRRNGQDDLVTQFTRADIDGVPFVPGEITPDSEISGLMLVLFLGGVESTAGLTGTLFKLLAENPDQRALAAARPVPHTRRDRRGTPVRDAATAHRAHHIAGGHPARRDYPGRWSRRARNGSRQPRRAPVSQPGEVRHHPGASAPRRLRGGYPWLPRERHWPGWRPRSHSKRPFPCSASMNWRARRGSTPALRTCTSGTSASDVHGWTRLSGAEPRRGGATAHHFCDPDDGRTGRPRDGGDQGGSFRGCGGAYPAQPDGHGLPSWTAGAHVDLVLDKAATRQYSLCGDPDDLSRIASESCVTRTAAAAPSTFTTSSRWATPCASVAPETTSHSTLPRPICSSPGESASRRFSR